MSQPIDSLALNLILWATETTIKEALSLSKTDCRPNNTSSLSQFVPSENEPLILSRPGLFDHSVHVECMHFLCIEDVPFTLTDHRMITIFIRPFGVTQPVLVAGRQRGPLNLLTKNRPLTFILQHDVKYIFHTHTHLFYVCHKRKIAIYIYFCITQHWSNCHKVHLDFTGINPSAMQHLLYEDVSSVYFVCLITGKSPNDSSGITVKKVYVYFTTRGSKLEKRSLTSAIVNMRHLRFITMKKLNKHWWTLR